MKNALWLLVLAPAALCACGSASSRSGADAPASASLAAAPADDDDAEEAVALSAVPAGVMSAAQGAVSGITFSSAEREVEGGATVYSLCGTANGKKYEVEVTSDGKVVEVEDCDDCDECDGEDDDD